MRILERRVLENEKKKNVPSLIRKKKKNEINLLNDGEMFIARQRAFIRVYVL